MNGVFKSLGCIFRSGIALCLTSRETARLFFEVLHHFEFPASVCECSSFSTSSEHFLLEPPYWLSSG